MMRMPGNLGIQAADENRRKGRARIVPPLKLVRRARRNEAIGYVLSLLLGLLLGAAARQEIAGAILTLFFTFILNLFMPFSLRRRLLWCFVPVVVALLLMLVVVAAATSGSRR